MQLFWRNMQYFDILIQEDNGWGKEANIFYFLEDSQKQ